jgi:hypothetical protein
MGRGQYVRPALFEMIDYGNAERRTFFRIRPGANFVEQYQRRYFA